MALSYKVFPGTPYYRNTSLTTKAGEIVNTTAATYVNTTYGTVSVGGSTYYVAYGMMVSFWNSSFTGTQIDDALNKVVNADTTPTANSTKMITSGGVKAALPIPNAENLGAMHDELHTIIIDGTVFAVLPSVTSSDNGKVLMVSSGAWAAASLPLYNGGVT